MRVEKSLAIAGEVAETAGCSMLKELLMLP